jgi:hypothetical protein
MKSFGAPTDPPFADSLRILRDIGKNDLEIPRLVVALGDDAIIAQVSAGNYCQ